MQPLSGLAALAATRCYLIAPRDALAKHVECFGVEFMVETGIVRGRQYFRNLPLVRSEVLRSRRMAPPAKRCLNPTVTEDKELSERPCRISIKMKTSITASLSG